MVAILVVTSLALRGENQPGDGELVILPRRQWYSFAPRGLIAIACGLAFLYLASEWWQALVGPEPRELSSMFGDDRVLKNVGGAPPTAMGWENHGASLLAMTLVVILLVWLLGADARRPFSTRRPIPEARAERTATARLVTQVAVGGTLLALGTVWVHTWAPVTEYVRIHEGHTGASGDLLISRYHGLVAVLRFLGWAAQGLGAGLLMRLGIDTLRARRAAKHSVAAPGASPATRQCPDDRIGAAQ